MLGRAGAVAVMLVAAVGGPGGLSPGSVAVQAQAGNPGEAFKAQLVAALASGNARQIAALVKYPLRVSHGMLAYPIPVENAAAMVQMHRLFFTPEMRCAIEESRVPRDGQPRPRFPLLVADGVVSLADGRVVAERTPQGFRITRLTVDRPGGGAAQRQAQRGDASPGVTASCGTRAGSAATASTATSSRPARAICCRRRSSASPGGR